MKSISIKGLKVKIDPSSGIKEPKNQIGIIEDARSVGLLQETESKQYLIRCPNGNGFWIPERYIGVIDEK